MKKQIKLARTFMPEILFPGTGLTPTTPKSVIPFNNVHTIWDVLTGKPYKIPGGGGDWSDGEEAQPGSYKEDGANYKRTERDLAIIKNLTDNQGSPHEQWKVKVEGGYKMFPSLEAAQNYRRKMSDKNIFVPWISRTKVAAIQGEQVIDASLERTFMVESLNFDSDIQETGAAFCVADGYFVTCAHVIKNYDKNTESNLDFSQYRGIIKVLLNDRGRKIEAEVVAFDGVNDIALLKANVKSDSFVFKRHIQVGEEIIAIGSPHGFENNASFGQINSIDRKVYFYENAPDYLFFDASVFPGNSGGPIIDVDDGSVVGMVTAIISEVDDYGLNAGLPIRYVEEFCTIHGVQIKTTEK